MLLINVCDVSGSEDFQEKQNIILQASIIIILVILIIIILHGSIITILVILIIIILHASIIIILDIIISSSVIIKKLKKIFIIQASTIQRQICEI